MASLTKEQRGAVQGNTAHRLAQGLLAVAALSLLLTTATRAGTTPPDPQQFQALIFNSARIGDVTKMKELLRSGMDVNLHDETGETPLIAAALAKQKEVARLLIDNKADLMARTNKGMTALHAAAYSGDANIAGMLIAHGANVNDQKNVAGITPLHAAAEEDQLAVVEQLIKSGADVKRLEANGYSAGSRAGWRRHWDVVSYLLKSGDTCQVKDIAGAPLYEKCTQLSASSSN
jgi:uncharacterized protein